MRRQLVSFTFAGAEVGATYNYSFTTDRGLGSVTGTGTITTGTDQITGIDLSGLADGTITLSVTLTDSNGNTGDEAVDTAIKDTSAPEEYSVNIDQTSITEANQSSVSFTFANAEVGATYNYSFTSSGGGTEVSGTCTITTATDQITGIDLSGLQDGTVTLSVTLTDNAGNTGPEVTDTVVKDVAAPAGYTVSIDQTEINNSNKNALSFTFNSAEVGATYNYSINSSGGGANVTGTGVIVTPADQITGIDVSGLNDGLLTLSVTLTDVAGNIGEPATSTVIKKTVSIEFTSSASTGFESQPSASIQVELSNISDKDVTVEYSVSGTATGSGIDYTLADGSLIIPAGNEAANIFISDIVNDTLPEDDETVIITLSNPQNASLGFNNVHTYTILDNDEMQTQTITFPPIEDQRLIEGQLDLEASGGDSGEPITFSIVTSPASGVASLSNGTIIFEGVGTVTVTASQAGNDFYLPAQDVTRTFSILTDEFLLPTLFTPNNDGFNDDLLLRGAARVERIEFIVFDRAGNEVYSADNIDELSQRGWDGTTNGAYQPQGTYIWVVSGNLTDGTRILINGKQKGIIALAR
ncbi:hypothetical protein GCM10011506_41460 [Marivirga lumbricoides]|uniref:Calx-beta domain-containing protein n=1 Tax=Marivirga lumbricoides TaxID=1046115 RepID=A0ABQ1N5L4_9BACT|nr:hypothetical protein GCM10011506_41460 [Marivirga lumbricoides]